MKKSDLIVTDRSFLLPLIKEDLIKDSRTFIIIGIDINIQLVYVVS